MRAGLPIVACYFHAGKSSAIFETATEDESW